jgi:hypothetical protein
VEEVIEVLRLLALGSYRSSSSSSRSSYSSSSSSSNSNYSSYSNSSSNKSSVKYKNVEYSILEYTTKFSFPEDTSVRVQENFSIEILDKGDKLEHKIFLYPNFPNRRDNCKYAKNKSTNSRYYDQFETHAYFQNQIYSCYFQYNHTGHIQTGSRLATDFLIYRNFQITKDNQNVEYYLPITPYSEKKGKLNQILFSTRFL